jgi:hypothetical protein
MTTIFSNQNFSTSFSFGRINPGAFCIHSAKQKQNYLDFLKYYY